MKPSYFIETSKFICSVLLNERALELFLRHDKVGVKKNYYNPAGIYLFKVNNRNTRTRCEICSKLTINTPQRRQWRRSGVFIVNFEHIPTLF